jgi:hypothetical protein
MLAPVHRLIARTRALFASRTLDRDFADELKAHVAMLAEDNVRRGMPPEEAQRAARLQVGSPTVLASRHRDVRGVPVVQTALRDARSAWRSIVAHPAHTIPVVLTLALGVGVTTALFSVLDSTLWRRVPFADAGRLVEIWNHRTGPQAFYSRGGTGEQVLAWRGQADLFEWVEAYEPATVVYHSATGAQLLDGARVTPGLFGRLGAVPAVGRLFTDADGRTAPSPAVILSHTFWTREFGRDEGIVAKTVTLDDEPYVVRGVMPADFRFPDAGAEIWLAHHVEAPPSPRRGAAGEQPPRLVPLGLTRVTDFSRADELARARG